MSDAAEDLVCRLEKLQSRFTWDLKEEDLELDDLSNQLQHDIDLKLGQRGAVAHYYRFLAYVRYLQGKPDEALSLLSQSEEETRECYGEDCERRLIVTYGDMAWLKYHTGDSTQSQSYCQRVEDILEKNPADSPSDLLPEVYGEKAWTFLKFSMSYYNKAIECSLRALKLQPDDWEWNNCYAIALFRTEPSDLKQHPEESPATTQLRRALELTPNDGVLLSLLALKLLHYHKYKEADGLVKKALEVGSRDPQVIYRVAEYYYKRHQLDQAIDLLKGALERNSRSAFNHHRLAECYRKKQRELFPKKPRPEKELQRLRSLSIYHLEETIKLRKGFNHAKADLALQYAEDSNRRRARELFNEVLETLEEESGNIYQFICRCYAEFCQYHTTDSEKDLAITYYKKALKCNSCNSEGKYCAKKLKQIAERRLDRDSGDATAYGILGAVAKVEGHLRGAVRYYERAQERDVGNAEYLSELCELRLNLN
ncbi:interferon-induced protein with tetratricopeptide repeats 5-like isoform X2 [Mugil cephalus]|uniref:interferon-induced protein with tetratricopeptide repeats 5-like isoform X2 n=1 Tax=Mugil cephalus TaxID=48193 RepID=UPI001FB6BED2|nr:interferon-induced protein with tetratricopeptide repeats 5-like isoform X2 [Mugil cephalus]